jgi:hypothetical protein
VIELTPDQPGAVERAIEELAAPPAGRPDPWWREGIDEALYGDATARPRSTLGADLA